MHIPLSSPSAMAQHEFLPITREIGNWNCRLPIANFRWLRTRRGTLDVGRWMFFFFRRPNDCPHRNLHDFVRTRAAAPFFPHPVPAAFRLEQGLVEEIGEIIDVPVRPQDYVTTTPAIAAVRPAFRHKFFSAKTDRPAPAFSCLHKNFYPINEHGGFKLPSAGTRVIPSEVEEPRLHNFTQFCGILLLRFLPLRMTTTRRIAPLSSLQLQPN